MARFTGVGGGAGIPGPQGPAGPQGEPGEGIGPQTWESSDENTYAIVQEHGGIEVETTSRTVFFQTFTVTSASGTDFSIELSGEDANLFSDYWNGNVYQRGIYFLSGISEDPIPAALVTLVIDGETTSAVLRLPYDAGFIQGDSVDLQVTYGSPPVKWWDADDLVNDQDSSDFRGAKIDYHAFITDGGIMIGTIYIARDGGDNNVTHIEVTSGGTDSGTAHLWNRSGNEKELYLYRVDGEGQAVRIHWTAQVYYSPEYYD